MFKAGGEWFCTHYRQQTIVESTEASTHFTDKQESSPEQQTLDDDEDFPPILVLLEFKCHAAITQVDTTQIRSIALYNN